MIIDSSRGCSLRELARVLSILRGGRGPVPAFRGDLRTPAASHGEWFMRSASMRFCFRGDGNFTISLFRTSGHVATGKGVEIFFFFGELVTFNFFCGKDVGSILDADWTPGTVFDPIDACISPSLASIFLAEERVSRCD